MLTIDGSRGEGGGQILRTSLGLSLVTGKPFRIEKIRANRPRPGLMRQHWTAVRAAMRVGGAEAEGAEIGSTALTFAPQRVTPGEYEFSVGSAGSVTLVLQTVLPALLTASGPSRLTLEGGTHNPFAPPFDFLARAFVPIINRMGPTVSAELQRPGFYPAGGGRMTVQVEPCERLRAIELLERGEVRGRRARAIVANLPQHIAERELHVIERRLDWERSCLHVEEADAAGPGNIVIIEIECEHITEVFTAFGERKKRAEDVARGAANEARRYLAAEVPVGEHLADQLLVPMALAGGGRFKTFELSGHAQTNIEVLGEFLECTVGAERCGPHECVVEVT
ncbi:MAG TPA: RNA 3'-terminal phosphate cyclase [Phycisphaerae bacterium]|nr:RNA 3'-terminal phosphate cyclase [Phycisphaerae bacterium]